MAVTDDKEVIAFRVPRRVADEVRSIAQREEESQSAIMRRLLRRGLGLERQRPGSTGGEAA